MVTFERLIPICTYRLGKTVQSEGEQAGEQAVRDDLVLLKKKVNPHTYRFI